MRADGGRIANAALIEAFQHLKEMTRGFRDGQAVRVVNAGTGETVHKPPRDGQEIAARMRALKRFFNDEDACGLDPMIKMALIHCQFESVHPFVDGNGRILNVLYLIRAGLLTAPVLPLGRYVLENRTAYYRLLQAIHDEGSSEAWEAWAFHLLEAVAETAKTTRDLVERILERRRGMGRRMREELPRIHSEDPLDNLFRHPCTRVKAVAADLGVTRRTAMRRLDALAEKGFVEKRREGRNRYRFNPELARLFRDMAGERRSSQM